MAQRTLRVEQDASGDYTTIGAAITYASTTGGANTSTTRWNIEVGVGYFNETISILQGVHIMGRGPEVTRIVGRVVMYSPCSIRNVFVEPAANTASELIDIQMGSGRCLIQSVHGSLVNPTNADICAIRQQGSGTTGNTLIQGCYYEVSNLYASAGNAQAVGIVMGSAQGSPIRCIHTGLRTITPTSGTAVPAFARNKASLAGADIYVSGCTWVAVGAKNPRAYINENANVKSGLDVRMMLR